MITSNTRAIILGCGSSGGVPRLGSEPHGGWGLCDRHNPKNRRRRCSLIVEVTSTEGTTRVLIDTSPDLREQLLDHHIESLDAILITHEHADHTHGIDDLRPLVMGMRKRLDCFMDDVTSRVMQQRFGYCFQTPPKSDYPPILNEKRMIARQSFQISGAGGAIDFTPFELQHGAIKALGFRFLNMAYVPDVNHILPESAPFFENLDTLILDSLRYKAHPTHFNLEQALEVIAAFKPTRTILTNLHNDMDYETLKALLPEHVTPAYDGMTISLNV